MKVLIASDHAGFKLKKILIQELQGEIKFDDLGPFSENSVDYPDYAKKLSKKIDLKNDLCRSFDLWFRNRNVNGRK